LSRRRGLREGLFQRYGPWALVAGGSQGLGAAFAAALAEEGFNLVLVARGAPALARSAEGLREGFGVEVREVVLDLGAESAAQCLAEQTRELELGLLVYNAAASHTGPFFAGDLDHYRRILEVNCRGALELCYTFGGRLAARGRGGILLMASLAGLQGTPWVTVYGASKAFLISLGEGLGEELGGRGVDLTVVCAGPIRTANFLSTKPDPARTTPLEMAPQAVARAGLRALGRKRLVVPGLLNRAAGLVMRLLPRQAAVAMMGRNTGRMYAPR
jgi:short-subunit dehydrogenase